MTSDQPDQPVEETKAESPILSAARQYFLQLAAKSDVLREEMQSATTRTKKKYIHKKLKKNNAEAIQVLSQLDGFSRNKALIDAAKKEQQAGTATVVEDEYR